MQVYSTGKTSYSRAAAEPGAFSSAMAWLTRQASALSKPLQVNDSLASSAGYSCCYRYNQTQHRLSGKTKLVLPCECFT